MISRLLSHLPRTRVLPRSAGLAVCLSACLAMWACSGPGSAPGATSTLPAAGGAARVGATATPHPFTYVALGASDAYGIGTDDPQDENWPTVLALQLGADTHLVNLGVPGTTLKQALAAHPAYGSAVGFHPSTVAAKRLAAIFAAAIRQTPAK